MMTFFGRNSNEILWRLLNFVALLLGFSRQIVEQIKDVSHQFIKENPVIRRLLFYTYRVRRKGMIKIKQTQSKYINLSKYININKVSI